NTHVLRQPNGPGVLLVTHLDPAFDLRLVRSLVDLVSVCDPEDIPRVRLDQGDQLVIPGPRLEQEVELKLHRGTSVCVVRLLRPNMGLDCTRRNLTRPTSGGFAAPAYSRSD